MVISDVVPYLLTDDPMEAFKAGIFKNNNGNLNIFFFFFFFNCPNIPNFDR